MNDISKKTGSLDFECPECGKKDTCIIYSKALDIYAETDEVPQDLLTEMSLCEPEKIFEYAH